MQKQLVPAGKHTKQVSHTKDNKGVAQSDVRATHKEMSPRAVAPKHQKRRSPEGC